VLLILTQVSAFAPTTEAAMAIGPAAMTLFIVFGGLYVNSNNVPAFLRWLPKVRGAWGGRPDYHYHDVEPRASLSSSICSIAFGVVCLPDARLLLTPVQVSLIKQGFEVGLTYSK
jgi:hypothetical protein